MDFSALNPKSSNALNLAARNNDVQNVRRLLKKINSNCVDNRGWTCLHEAAFHDSLDCLQIILNRRDCRPLVESHEGHTALYVACQNTSTRCIQYLLENVPEIVHYGSREGFTPLHLVSQQGRIDTLQLLIEHGAMLDVVDFDGDTPLHEACIGKHPEAVNILLHAGAQSDIPNEHNATPLHMACSGGCLESVKYLYPFIPDINVLDSNGDSPLMAACNGENEDVIQFLLENGANPNFKNNHDKLALDIVLTKGLVKGFKLLLQATDKEEIDLFFVCDALAPSLLNIEIIDIIFSSDLDPEFFMFQKPWFTEENIPLGDVLLPTYKEVAPLCAFLNVAEYIYKISVEKLTEFIYLLLMKGMLVNAIDDDEMPPMVWFLLRQHSTCFDYVLHILVKMGCDIDYCSKRSYEIDDLVSLVWSEPDLFSMLNFPDALYVSLRVSSDNLPILMTYSLQCDPGYVLKFAKHFKIDDRLSTQTITKLTKMIDSECEISDYESLTRYVPPLKHLSRLQVRQLLKNKDGTSIPTQDFLQSLQNLPLPEPIKQYLRFL